MHRNLANAHGIPTSKRKSSTRRLKTLSRFNPRHFTEAPARCSSLTYELPNHVDDDCAQIHFYRRVDPRASPEAAKLKNESPARPLPSSVLLFVSATIAVIHNARYVRSPREKDKLTRQRKDGRDAWSRGSSRAHTCTWNSRQNYFVPTSIIARRTQERRAEC